LLIVLTDCALDKNPKVVKKALFAWRYLTWNFSKVQIKLIENDGEEQVQRLSESSNSEMRQFSSILLDKIHVVTGTLPKLNPKCSNPSCSKRKENMKKCGNCKVVKYCSKECQVTHWKNGHKAECERFKETASERKGKHLDVDRTVHMKFIQDHIAEIKDFIFSTGLQIDNAVLQINFLSTTPSYQCWDLKLFFEQKTKEDPYDKMIDTLNRLNGMKKPGSLIVVTLAEQSAGAFLIDTTRDVPQIPDFMNDCKMS